MVKIEKYPCKEGCGVIISRIVTRGQKPQRCSSCRKKRQAQQSKTSHMLKPQYVEVVKSLPSVFAKETKPCDIMDFESLDGIK
jgi:hypothetical protein